MFSPPKTLLAAFFPKLGFPPLFLIWGNCTTTSSLKPSFLSPKSAPSVGSGFPLLKSLPNRAPPVRLPFFQFLFLNGASALAPSGLVSSLPSLPRSVLYWASRAVFPEYTSKHVISCSHHPLLPKAGRKVEY